MSNQLPGYPSNQNLRNQASNAANAAVPTRGQIQRPYERSINDVNSFSRALAELLGHVGQVSDQGYRQAQTSQAGIDAAARARLQALGGPFGAGSAAAVGGMGDSAMSHLISNHASAHNYAAQLPAVGASRGALAQQTLVQNLHDALQQRNHDYQNAYQTALSQAQQNALARSTALASITQNNRQFHLAEQQFGESQREFNINAGLQRAQLAARDAQFSSSQSQQWREFMIEQRRLALGQTAAGKPGGPLAGFTRSEVQHLQSQAVDGATSAAQHRVGIQQYLGDAVARGIPKPIALLAATTVFGRFRNAPKGSSGALAYQSYLEWLQSAEWQRDAGRIRNEPRHPSGRGNRGQHR